MNEGASNGKSTMFIGLILLLISLVSPPSSDSPAARTPTLRGSSSKRPPMIAPPWSRRHVCSQWVCSYQRRRRFHFGSMSSMSVPSSESVHDGFTRTSVNKGVLCQIHFGKTKIERLRFCSENRVFLKLEFQCSLWVDSLELIHYSVDLQFYITRLVIFIMIILIWILCVCVCIVYYF